MLHSPYVKQLFFVKINGNLVKKQKHILQISVQELHNDMILTISQGGHFGARTVDGKLYIGYTSLRKYTKTNIKNTSKRDNITCG